MINLELKDRIRAIRAEAKLNQTEFGERIGASQSTVAGWEIGRKEPMDVFIVAICNTFNVRQEYLLEGKGPMHSEPTQESLISNYMGQLLQDDSEDAELRKRFIASVSKMDLKDLERLQAIAEALIGVKADELGKIKKG